MQTNSTDFDRPNFPPEQKTDGMNSPNDVRSYRHQNERLYYEEEEMGISERLGNLPIVREGSVLSEEEDNMILMNEGIDYSKSEDLSDYDDGAHGQFFEYELEQEELRKEINLTKIAFAAYRGAVLHLVHNQGLAGRGKRIIDEKKEQLDVKDISDDEFGSIINQSESNDSYMSCDSVDTEGDANRRMTILEETAKNIVETKAKACFDAVLVAKEFEIRRAARRHRQLMLVGGLSGLASKDDTLSELRNMMKKREEEKTAQQFLKSETVENSKTNYDTKVIASKTPTKSNSVKTNETEKKTASVGPIVRLKKKPSRHADCIKATLPRFQFEHESDEHDSPEDRSSPKSAQYGTTSWIKKMVQWRIQKTYHQQALLSKCNCLTCLEELKIFETR